MAENKSDFIKDPQVLKDQATSMIEKLRVGFNLSIAKQPNISMAIRKEFGGIENPVIVFKDAVGDFSKMLSSDGWKYGVYYLQGSPKNGFHKMIDGKHIFIETHQEYSPLSTASINSAEEMKQFLIAKNPLLDQTNVHVDGAKITIGVPYLDHLEMPSTEWVYDAETGKIHSTARDYSLDVEVTNAASMNDGYKTAEGTSRSIESREALSLNRERQELKDGDGVVADESASVNVAQKNNLKIDLADFSPKNMYKLFQQYRGTIEEDGDFKIASAEGSQDGRSTSLNLKDNEQSSTLTQQEKEWVFISTLWVNACLTFGKKEAQAFEDEGCQQTLGTIMYFLRTGERSANAILTFISKMGRDGCVEIANAFLSSLNVQAGFEIDFSNVKLDDLIQNEAMSKEDEGMTKGGYEPGMNKPNSNFNS